MGNWRVFATRGLILLTLGLWVTGCVAPSPVVSYSPTEAPSLPPTEAPVTPLSPTAMPKPTLQSSAPVDPAVLANADVVRLLDDLRQRGISMGEPHESRAAFLYPVSGAAYEFEQGRLYLHPFASDQAAEQRARQIPPELTRSIIDWVAPAHFYRCRSALALYLGTNAQVMQALTDICGPEVASAASAAYSEPAITPAPTTTPTGKFNTELFPSPDGKWIARVTVALPVVARGVSVGDIYYTRLQVAKTDETRVWTVVDEWSPFGLGYTTPRPLRWSKDGRYLYFTNLPVLDGCAVFVNGSDLQRLDLESGMLLQIVSAGASWISVSPDELLVITIRRTAQGLQLVRHDLRTALEQATELRVKGEGFQAGDIVWSPDGAAIMLTVAIHPCTGQWAEATSVVRVDATSLSQTVLVDADKRLFTSVEWPIANWVVLRDADYRLWWLDASTGQVETVSPPTPSPERGPGAPATATPRPDTSTVPAEPVLTWKREFNGRCATVVLDASGRAGFGPCAAPDRFSSILPEVERPQELQHFLERFQPFESSTPEGQIDFKGHGDQVASPTEQRAIANWAGLVEQELEYGRSGASWGMAMAMVQDRTDPCIGMQMQRSGQFAARDCRTGLESNGWRWMTADQLAQLYTWLDTFRGFEAHMTDDDQSVRLVFSGRGAQEATEAEQKAIFGWAKAVYTGSAGK